MSENLIVTLVFLLFFSPVFYDIIVAIKLHWQGRKIDFKKTWRLTRNTLLVTIIFSAIFILLNHTNYLNYQKPITFENYSQITFENFRGFEFFKKTLYGSERFAYVVTTIDTKIGKDYVEVKSLFHPSRSFVYNKNINNQELLNHEIYHFKVTELFVRKAKEKISKFNSFDETKFDNVIQQMKKEEKVYQHKYDFDTFHSYVLNEQKRYEKEVDSLLILLADFKKPRVIIDGKN
jgi:hypothetical protein